MPDNYDVLVPHRGSDDLVDDFTDADKGEMK